jgi:hypothetical protein
MLLVLGCKSFGQLCATKLDRSTTLANRLVDVASAMTRDEATSAIVEGGCEALSLRCASHL